MADPLNPSSDDGTAYQYGLLSPTPSKGLPGAIGGPPKADAIPPVTADQYQGALTDVQKGLAQKQQSEGAAYYQFERDQARYHENAAREESQQAHELGDLKPWDSKGELAKREVSIWEQFGQPAFVLSMLASAFSAKPMNSALLAGGEAMTALKENRMADYQRAFDAWKVNSNLAAKRFEMEGKLHAEYAEDYTKDMEAYRIRKSAIADRFGDKRLKALYDHGMFKEADEIVEGRERARKTMVETQEVIDHANMRLQFVQAWTKDQGRENDPSAPAEALARFEALGKPQQELYYSLVDQYFKEHNESPPIEKRIEFMQRATEASHYGRSSATPTREKSVKEIRDEYMRDHPGASFTQADAYARREMKESEQVLSGTRREQLEAHEGQYDLAINDDIPEAINLLDSHIGVAGLGGKITRPIESVQTILGSDDASRHQFESVIERLRLVAPNLLLDRTGRPLSSEHERIEKIIRGLNMGDTAEVTRQNLLEIKIRLEKLRQGVRNRLRSETMTGAISGRSEAAEPSAKPPATERWWEGYPTVQ